MSVAFDSSWKDRALAIGILLSGLIALGLVVIAPLFLALRSPWNRIAEARQQIQSLQRQAVDGPALEQRMKALTTMLASSPGLLGGENASLAAAQLQGELSRIIENAGGEVQSISIESPASNGGFEKVTVHFQSTVPRDRLSGLVYGVETHEPFFFLTNLHIVASDNPDVSHFSERDLNLQIDGDVEAFRLVDSQ